MQRLLRFIVLPLVLAALFIPFTASVASAHGHTEVGDYELVIGFHNEPAYQGEPNGLDLFVTNKKTNEKVNNLSDTLQAEIISGSSKRTFKIEPQWGVDGAYTAHVLPTEAGDYTWHIFGSINGTPVDVSMTSSPDTFGAVEAKSEVSFPAAEPTLTELRAQSLAAQQSAQTALIVGGLGVLLGIVGIAVGVWGLRARRAAQAAPVRQVA